MEVAADSSSLIAFFAGSEGKDCDALVVALQSDSLWLPPPVVAELFSSPQVVAFQTVLLRLPVLPLQEGYWRRTGETRRALLQKKLKARTIDALICQCCLDADMPLITRDADFRHYAQWLGLRLA